MTGIGSINGMGDGTFNPAGNVTRAQAAKMVAYAVLGADVAKNLPVSASSFKDVDSNFNWAIPSIEYLVKAGVINGRGNGTFDPNGKVTAYEIAKMLLVAAGYGKNGEFTGNSWVLNVAITAQKQGVFTGSKTTDRNAPATREECALYCFNVLTTVQKVVYDKTKDTYVDDNTTTTLADEVYKMQPVAEGVLTANQANSTNKYTTVGGVNYNIETGLDLVGHFVRVYYKSAHTGAATPGVTYAVVDLSTKVEVAKDITTAAAWNTAFGTGTVTKDDTKTITFTNYSAASPTAISGLTIGSAAKAGTYILYKGDVKSYLASATYSVDVVSSYTAPTATATGRLVLESKGTITLPKTGDTTTYSVYQTPAAKDVVIYQTTGALTTITKATTATGKVSAVNLTATPNTITAGSTYSKSAAFTTTSSILSFETFATALVGKDCTFYLDTNGAVVAVVANSSTTDAGLAYFVDAYEETVTGSYGVVTKIIKAQCVDMAGKEVIYTLGKTDGTFTDNTGNASATLTATSADSAFAGYLCKVSTAYNPNLKADVATFARAADTVAVTNSSTYYGKSETDKAVAGTAKIADGHYFAADTQFVYVTGAGSTGDLKVTTATGAQTIPASTKYSYYSTKAASATNYAVKYVVVKAQPAAAPSTSLMFVPKAFNTYNAVSYTDASGVPGTAYNNVAFIDGTPSQSIKVTSVEAATINKAGFYTYAKDATTGLYDLTSYDITSTLTGAGRVGNVYGSYLSVTNNSALVTNGKDITDANAANAKIVDVVYLNDLLTNGAGNTTVSQITTLAGLVSAGDNATVFYSYTVNPSTNAKTVDTIYVVAHPTTFTISTGATPANVSISSGSTANLTVTATASDSGAHTYTYQWYSNTTASNVGGTLIPGANAASYTTPTLTNTSYYYCVVSTTGANPVTSGAATVTVS